jgi:hypothetical protein
LPDGTHAEPEGFRDNSGGFATLAAIRRAWSLVRSGEAQKVDDEHARQDNRQGERGENDLTA